MVESKWKRIWKSGAMEGCGFQVVRLSGVVARVKGRGSEVQFLGIMVFMGWVNVRL